MKVLLIVLMLSITNSNNFSAEKQLYMESLKQAALVDYQKQTASVAYYYGTQTAKKELQSQKRQKELKRKKKKKEKIRKITKRSSKSVQKKQEDIFKLQGMEKDPNYSESKVSITGEERRLLEALVYGEAGDQGFIGCSLVAQAMKDTMNMTDNYSVQELIKAFHYSGAINKGTNSDAKKAVQYVFEDGHYVVQHRIIYFYDPSLINSKFHESQRFIVEYKNHRFFDRR